MSKINFEDLELVKKGKKNLGTGAYASVKLVRHKPTGKKYALKEVKKITKHSPYFSFPAKKPEKFIRLDPKTGQRTLLLAQKQPKMQLLKFYRSTSTAPQKRT